MVWEQQLFFFKDNTHVSFHGFSVMRIPDSPRCIHEIPFCSQTRQWTTHHFVRAAMPAMLDTMDHQGIYTPQHPDGIVFAGSSLVRVPQRPGKGLVIETKVGQRRRVATRKYQSFGQSNGFIPILPIWMFLLEWWLIVGLCWISVTIDFSMGPQDP